MHKETLDALIAAVQAVLSVQAFMVAEPMDIDLLEAPGESCLRATIRYSGVADGGMALVFPVSLAAELAANMLGVPADESDDRSDAADALMELLNIACGQYLTRRYGTAPVFTLTIPQVEHLGAGEWEHCCRQADVVGLDVDFSPALVRIWSTEQC